MDLLLGGLILLLAYGFIYTLYTPIYKNNLF